MHRKCRVDPCDDALASSLLVSDGSVHLAGQIETRQLAHFEIVTQLMRGEIIVLDRIAEAGDTGLLEAGNRPQELLLGLRTGAMWRDR